MITRKDLANDIWKAYDIMRRDDGTTGILQYMEQISWMVFLKVFEDIENRLEMASKLESREYDRIIIGKFRWPNWTTIEAKNNAIINFVDLELFPHLRTLKGSLQHEMISLLFNEIKGNQMKSAFNFKDVIDIVDGINFNDPQDSHTISKVYEDSLVKLGREGGIAGEFYTPRPIVRMMVKMVSPEIGQRIFDPFCGSCGFIVESFKHIKESRELGVEQHEILQRSTFYGQEKKPLAHLMGVMNCILHDLLTPSISRKNTLEDNNRNVPESDRYDIILTNPPFGGTENKQIQQNFTTQSQATELLALQYVMKHLRPGGRCAIIVPEGVLSRGDAFARVKQELLDPQSGYNLHTIVSLPAGVFANVTSSGQGPKASIIFFDRDGPTKEIWYYELRPKNGRNFTRANSVTDEDLIDCLSRWKNRELSENSWIVDTKHIMERSYDMTGKNPTKKNEMQYDQPEALIADMIEREKSILSILEEVQSIIVEGNGTK